MKMCTFMTQNKRKKEKSCKIEARKMAFIKQYNETHGEGAAEPYYFDESDALSRQFKTYHNVNGSD